VYIKFDKDENINVNNLPLTIKEIVIEDEKYKKFIKIPYGSIITIQKTKN
jgi:hypothetical protein